MNLKCSFWQGKKRLCAPVSVWKPCSVVKANSGESEQKIHANYWGLDSEIIFTLFITIHEIHREFWPKDAAALKMIGVCVFRRVCVCVIVCQGPHACIVPNTSRCPHHFPALPVWMDITLTSIKPSPSRTLPVIVLPLFFLFLFPLSFPLCNYKVAETVSPVSQPLAPWHWEWERKRSPVSSIYIPSFFRLAARQWCCLRWWLCIRVSTCAVSFPVHHCAGEADDWIQSAGWLMRAPLDLGQPINHVIRANVPWKRQTSAKE